MIEYIKEKLQESYQLLEKNNEKFAKIKVNGMSFDISSFSIEGVGNLGIMEASGFFGLMNMITVIINPFEVDAPLFSYDRIHAFGNDTFIMELYDTCLKDGFEKEQIRGIKSKYGSLPVYDHGTHWYDDILMDESIHLKGKKQESATFDALAVEYIEAYVNALNNAEKCDKLQKTEKAKAYSDGLLNNGGPSTDIFVKKFGKEFTTELFEKVLFGTNS